MYSPAAWRPPASLAPVPDQYLQAPSVKIICKERLGINFHAKLTAATAAVGNTRNTTNCFVFTDQHLRDWIKSGINAMQWQACIRVIMLKGAHRRLCGVM